MGKLRKRMSFSRIDEVLEMPNLIEVQKNSYQRFLDTDLREVLNDVSPITDYNGNLVLNSWTTLSTRRKTPSPAAASGTSPMQLR